NGCAQPERRVIKCAAFKILRIRSMEGCPYRTHHHSGESPPMTRHTLLLPICSLLLINCGGGSHRNQTGDGGGDANKDTGTGHDTGSGNADTKPAMDAHDAGVVVDAGSTVDTNPAIDAPDGGSVADTASEHAMDTAPATYTVGGTVTGLSGSGL